MESSNVLSAAIFMFTMLLITCIGVFVVPALIDLEYEPAEKCPFRDTVDLSNHTALRNGSYLYDGIWINANQTSSYKHRLKFLDKPQPSELHIRGCICDRTKHTYCVRLCCERGKYFKPTSRRCEKLRDVHHMPNEMEILMRNKTRTKWNIFKHFVIQHGTPCEKPEIISLTEDPWILREDGYLAIDTDNTTLDTVNYCISPQYDGQSQIPKLMAMSCPMKTEKTPSMVLNTYGIAISVVFFIPTILIHLAVKELRSSLTGKLQTCYLIALATGYSIMGYINMTQGRWPVSKCRSIGFTGYYFFMSAYLWLGVLCYDMWKTFRECKINNEKNRDNMNRFILYSVFVWGTAGTFTLFVIWAQLTKVIMEQYKPGIGLEMCWIDTRKWSAALYFYLPNFAIMVFNITAFFQVAMVIYEVKRDVSTYETNREKKRRENVLIILRLFLIMGISWIMDIISYCCRKYESLDFLFGITDFSNASQGVLIFFLFILRQNVLIAIKEL
uniref:G-protein coupled receptors family 2 profile 2 domain-containing protein n=1 Tax=Musca domestica TaxID=7370 RepID=A0A1I8NKJ3_MUSDO